MEQPDPVHLITWGGVPTAADDPPSGIDAVVRVASAAALRRAVVRHRPAVIVLAVPPAGIRTVRTMAGERTLADDLRLVVLTEPGAAALRIDALAWGADEALPVPLAPAELAGRVALLARRIARARAAGTPVAPGVVLDPVSHALRRDGRRVHLRPMEYRLLAELARHPGSPRSRADLLATVWQGRAAADSRTVDVHIRWLRAKIERDARRPVHLVTVRGLGYVLEPATHGRNGGTER